MRASTGISGALSAGAATAPSRSQPGAACAPELQPTRSGPQPAVCRVATDLESSLLALVERESEPTVVSMTQVGAAGVLGVPALPRVAKEVGDPERERPRGPHYESWS